MPRRLLWLPLVATCAAAISLAALGAVSAGVRDGALRGAETSNVDVELVLAVDVSYSMDPDEQALQREGYVSALKSGEFLDALKHGTHGRIALTYIEWAGVTDQKILLPWRLIDSAASAAAVADDIAPPPYPPAYPPPISTPLPFPPP